jgi:hypothetical protein
LSRECGILNISQPYTPPRPVKEIALLLQTISTPFDVHEVRDVPSFLDEDHYFMVVYSV